MQTVEVVVTMCVAGVTVVTVLTVYEVVLTPVTVVVWQQRAIGQQAEASTICRV